MKKRGSRIMNLAYLTTLTVAVWISFDVYRNFTKEPPVDVPAPVLAPIDPSLDDKVLSDLEQREIVPDSLIDSYQPAEAPKQNQIPPQLLQQISGPEEATQAGQQATSSGGQNP